MQKRKMALVALFSLLAIVLVMMLTTVWVSAADPGGDPIEVDGVFHGDPYGAKNDPDSNYYIPVGTDPGRGTVYEYRNGSTLYVAVVVSITVNDNVFAPRNTNPATQDYQYMESAGWDIEAGGNVRPAKHLIHSDNMTMKLSCGSQSWTWAQDYIYRTTSDGLVFISGLIGDGGGISPSTNDTFASSGVWNLMNSTWNYRPGGTLDDTLWRSVNTGNLNTVKDEDGWAWGGTGSYPWWNETYQWEWAIVYEMGLDVSACGTNPIFFEIVSAHNSPSKDGDPDVPIKIYDFGDLPDGYGTTLGSNGARHQLVAGGPILGFIVDAEPDGQPPAPPDADADGDDGNRFYGTGPDDEDGVVRAGDIPRPGEDFTLWIAGTPGAWVNAFIDWNGNGVFEDDERYAFQLDTPTVPPVPDEPWDWPEYHFLVSSSYDPTKPIYARFRVSSAGGLGPDGLAPDGEVEDYVWSYSPSSVGLVSFTATADNISVLLQWESATEINTLGYNIERTDSPDGPWTQLNDSPIYDEAVLGSPLGASYDYTDTFVEEGLTYYYRLVSIDTFGAPSYYGPITVTVPAIGEPLMPPSPAGLHRVYLPFVTR